MTKQEITTKLQEKKESKIPDYLFESGTCALSWVYDLFLRMPLRNAHVGQKVGPAEHFYYYNSGDFKDGFTASMFTNIFLTSSLNSLNNLCSEYLPEQNNVRKFVEKASQKHDLINIVSGLIGSGIVIAEETRGYFSTPDLKDIPAGLAGVAAQMLLRYFSIRDHNKKKKLSLSEVQND